VPIAAVGDHLAEGAIAVNARRVITYVNRIATALLGVRADALIGRDVLSIAGPSERDPSSRFARALGEVLERGVEHVLSLNDTDAGPSFNVDYCRLLPIADGGALILLGETMSPSVSERLSGAYSLAEILQRINQSLEVERVLHLLATHSAELIGGNGGAVLLLEEGALVPAAGAGSEKLMVGRRQSVAESFAGDVVRTHRPRRTDDLDATVRDSGAAMVGEEESGRVPAIAAPLMIADRPIGALLVTGSAQQRFSDHHEQLLVTLATHGAIALENAKLYRAAAQTARHAGIIAATARTLALNASPDELYAGLARLVTESLRADGFSIHTADAQYDQVTLLHSHGIEPGLPNATLGTFWDTPAGRVIRSVTPAFITSAAGTGLRDELTSASPTPESGSTAILPLIIEGRAGGVLTLRFRQPRDFDDRERALLIDFSTAVAVAMRNASLVGDLERRAMRLSAVAKVQLAMSRTELPDVYAEIHRAVASSVSRVSCFALLLVDQVEPVFHPQLVVVDGLVTWSSALPPVPVGDCAASSALRTGQPVVSNQPARSWGSLVPGSSETTPTSHLASEIAVPMVHGDRTLGVLIVQSRHRGAFTAEDVELLSIIARQAGVAIENARLFQAQREERQMAEAAARIARLALASRTATDAAAAILDVVGDVVRVDGAAIGLLNRENAVVYIGTTGSARSFQGSRIPVPMSIAHDVLRDVPLSGDAPPVITTPSQPASDASLARGGVVLALAAKDRMLGVLTAAAPPDGMLPQSSIDAVRRLAPSVALAIDVQLLGEGERHRHARERMLATALATMDQPVFVLSLDRRVLYANDAAVREYGYTLDELTTMTVDVLVASAVPLRAGHDLSRTPANVVVAEHVHRRRDGSQFPATVALSFIRQDNGAPIGQVLSVRNLTDERRITEQLRQSEKLAALGELVAGVAHELNNPLAGISAFAQLLLEEELNADQRESARLIKREADRAVGVIRDLLLFSRKAGPSTIPVDINGLVQLTLRLRAYSLRSSGVQVETYLDAELPEVSGDDQKLQQVILNLIVNAEYAMRRTATKRLIIRTAREGDSVVTEVTDTGTGMAEDTLQRVFEPFFTTKPAGEGTGLGLSVSYGIVEAHGGTITVESVPGRGTTFRILLPVATAFGTARDQSA
jgi:PAS domain S-box-containing protein